MNDVEFSEKALEKFNKSIESAISERFPPFIMTSFVIVDEDGAERYCPSIFIDGQLTLRELKIVYEAFSKLVETVK